MSNGAQAGIPSIGRRRLEVLAVFLKIGALGFGVAAIWGLIQAEVQERRWLSKERFVEAWRSCRRFPAPRPCRCASSPATSVQACRGVLAAWASSCRLSRSCWHLRRCIRPTVRCRSCAMRSMASGRWSWASSPSRSGGSAATPSRTASRSSSPSRRSRRCAIADRSGRNVPPRRLRRRGGAPFAAAGLVSAPP